MKPKKISVGLSAQLCLIIWAGIILLPLLSIILLILVPVEGQQPEIRIIKPLIHSIGLSAIIAAMAVLLGYIPGLLFATSQRYQGLLLFLLISPLVLPRYVLYYGWSLLLSPTTKLGSLLARLLRRSRRWRPRGGLAAAQAQRGTRLV